MGAGIATYFHTDFNFSTKFLVFASLTSCLLSAFTFHLYKNSGQNRWLASVLILSALTLFTIGYAVSSFRTNNINTVLLEQDLPFMVIEGRIEKIVNLEGSKAKRIILDQVNIDGKSYRVRLKSYHFKGDEWAIGDKVSVKAKLIAPGGPTMPDGFDFSRKAFYDDISAVGYTIQDAIIIDKNATQSDSVEQLRQFIGNVIYDNMEIRNAAVAQALLTGERAGINQSDTEAFRVSGLAHLLAISGLHIGMVAGCVFFFIRLGLACIPNFALHYPIKKWAAGCAIIIAFSYMILAGATVPTVRAFIMSSLVLLAIILDRSALNLRLVSLAALFVMITTPEAIVGPSFILSFSAVAALIVFYKNIGRKLLVNARAYKPLWRPFYYVLGVIVTSFIATLATAPFSIMFFNRFALYSILSNIVAIPLMGFLIMPFGLMGILLIPFGLDGLFWIIMEWGIAHILNIADIIASYRYASLAFPSFNTWESFIICLGFIFLLFWNGKLRWIGLMAIIAAFINVFISPQKMIMISTDMKAIIYVDKSVDNIYLIGKMDSYTKSNWLGFHGYNMDVNIPRYESGDNINNNTGYCDDYMCRLNIDSVNVTVLINALKKDEVCDNSDIIIADFPLDKSYCPSAKIIDRFDVWKYGATSITFNDDKYSIKTVKN